MCIHLKLVATYLQFPISICMIIFRFLKVSDYVERTNYYSAKGIMQIELKTYEYAKRGVMMKRYYLVLRCNPSIIVGDSKILLIDLEKYSSNEILERLMKRIYEINEFRYIRLDKQPLALFLTNRADVAEDILVDFPQLGVALQYVFHMDTQNGGK